MSDALQFGERLRAAMAAAGVPLKAAVLEREFNLRFWGAPVTLQAARRWLRGEAIPTQDKLLVLADWLRIEPQVLRFGDSVRLHIRQQRQRWEDALSYGDRATLEAYLALTPAQRETVRAVIMALKNGTPGP